jgi:hypothetical protein
MSSELPVSSVSCLSGLEGENLIPFYKQTPDTGMVFILTQQFDLSVNESVTNMKCIGAETARSANPVGDGTVQFVATMTRIA